MYQLRHYQAAAVDLSYSVCEPGEPTVFVAPTGSGKTVMGCEPLRRCAAKGNRGVWLATRLELVEQASATLTEYGVDHGIVMAGFKPRPEALIQVCSVPTLLARQGAMPPARVAVADEAHLAMAPGYRSIIEHYRDAIVWGLTATPYLYDGSGLSIFKHLIVVAQNSTLLDEKYLVPLQVFSPPMPREMEHLPIVRGDFATRAQSHIMQRPKVVGDVIKTWMKLGYGRTAAVFCSDKEHGRTVHALALRAGIPAEYIDDSTPRQKRREARARISSGESLWAVNVGVLSLGWDMPRVSYIAKLRRTLSRALDRQQTGRGSRPYDGKIDCVIADHVGNIWLHGMPNEDEAYSLDGCTVAKVRELGLRKCGECFSVSASSALKCERCGAEFKVKHRAVATVAGELSAGATQDTWAQRTGADERARLLAKWTAVGARNDHKKGYGSSVYKGRFGAWPDANTRYRAEQIKFPLFLVPGGACGCGSRDAGVDEDSVRCKTCGQHLAQLKEEWR